MTGFHKCMRQSITQEPATLERWGLEGRSEQNSYIDRFQKIRLNRVCCAKLCLTYIGMPAPNLKFIQETPFLLAGAYPLGPQKIVSHNRDKDLCTRCDRNPSAHFTLSSNDPSSCERGHARSHAKTFRCLLGAKRIPISENVDVFFFDRVQLLDLL